MIFQALSLSGAFLIIPELVEDERGFFSRSFCKSDFEKKGLNSEFVQQSISYNESFGTLRGLHYQAPPCEEVKLVRCTRGKIFDVIVDLRQESPTFKQWLSFELSAENRYSLYIPAGFAHGYLTCSDKSEVYYQMSLKYQPDYSRTINWNHPDIGVDWPFEPKVISTKDKNAGYEIEQ